MATDVKYNARDLLCVPSLLSLTRVPLAVAFPFVVGDARAAVAVLVATGLSDVLDGWIARRFNQCTPLGAVLDGATDKLFVATVAVTLLVTGRMSPFEMLLLGARDLGEILTVLALIAHRDTHAFHEEQRASAYGKVTTMLQFVAVVLALFGRTERLYAALCAALVGVVAAVQYARRAW